MIREKFLVNLDLNQFQKQILMEIISSQHLHLELDVFEGVIAKVKKGQKISYTIPAYGDKIYHGEVDVIGKEFNSNAKTVRVHGHVSGEKPPFIKDLFMNAKIWLSDETATALPEKSIITDGSSSFVFAAINNQSEEEIEFEFNKILDGFSPIIKSVEDKFVEHRDELLIMKNV